MRMMMMMMMKMLVVFVLSCVVCVSADPPHQDIVINGCSESDGEFMYALDGEELWYADFVHQKGVEPQPDFIVHMSYEEGTYEGAVQQQHVCKENLKIAATFHKNPRVPHVAPSSPIIYPRDEVELDQENILICHVGGFYPAPVNISWTKNTEKVTEGTSGNVPFPGKDGTFSQVSSLTFTPQSGDIYSCSVTHPGLDQPLTRMWDVEKTPPSVGPAVFCGLGLTVGLLGVAAGTFFLIKGNECS